MNQEAENRILSFRETFPCLYFEEERISSVEYVFPDKEYVPVFHEFLSRGYRRLGNILYRNVCAECSACQPIRLETRKFMLSRSQKRTLRKNQDIRIKVQSKTFITLKKLELFRKYLTSKHEKNEDSRDYESLLSVIHYGYPRAIEMDYFLGDELVGVGIIDEGTDSLSSNYFYYDTDYLTRRLGIFSVLKEISFACLMEKKFYYLGFYIEENPKMSYKKFFRPNALLKKGEWKEFMK